MQLLKEQVIHCTQVARNRIQWLAVVYTVKKLKLPNSGEFKDYLGNISF
jgi:hypothetical protein